MQAGDLDRRIALQRYSITYNEDNEPIEGWAEVATLSANRADLSDSERLSSYGVVASIVSRFLVRSSELSRSISPTDRIDHDNRQWEITGIKEAKFGRHQFLEITATAGL